MATASRAYFTAIESSLTAAFALTNVPCQDVERYSKPEIEFGTSKELLLAPVTICHQRSADEKCFIEVRGVAWVLTTVARHDMT